MQPLIPYLLGQKHPKGKRLVNSQLCLRAQDIEEVGDTSHTTFFEMLGNWSLGDYSKRKQIQQLSKFLFNEAGLDPKRVYVSCYGGNRDLDIPRDNEAITCWQEEFNKLNIDAKVITVGKVENGAKKGMQGGRIFLYDGNENWWSRAGDEENTPVGEPCGPDSEVFFDFGEQLHDEQEWGKPHPASDSPRFMEIGNSVFMSYRKTESGVEELPSKNIDFGGGLERIAAAAIDSPDVYKISVMWPIIQKLEELSGKKYDSHTNAMRVIADHLRGAVFLAAEGVAPSNKEQGYVLRRLLRRATRYGFELGVEQNFLEEVVPVIAKLYKKDFPQVAKAEKKIIQTLASEEKLFRQTLRKGLKVLKQVAQVETRAKWVDASEGWTVNKQSGTLGGPELFLLYDTYGFPVELTKEEAFKQDIKITESADGEFRKLMEKQRERSQTATKGVFKGGLADHSDETTKLHTATHLMYEALRQVLGDNVIQRGSNVNAERTRFDFSHPQKVTKDQQTEIEQIVNEQIAKDLQVECREYPTKKALQMGAKGAFGDKYGDRVKVYTMAEPGKKPFSVEICGGPHVEHTGQLGSGGKKFKIKKEEASSAGVRRIKAVLQ
jgi:alanyl-tRNA synthetase